MNPSHARLEITVREQKAFVAFVGSKVSINWDPLPTVYNNRGGANFVPTKLFSGVDTPPSTPVEIWKRELARNRGCFESRWNFRDENRADFWTGKEKARGYRYSERPRATVYDFDIRDDDGRLYRSAKRGGGAHIFPQWSAIILPFMYGPQSRYPVPFYVTRARVLTWTELEHVGFDWLTLI